MKSFGADAGTICVRPGETFRVELEAIPGAGYTWVVTPTEGIEEVSSDFAAPSSDRVGGSTVQRLTLRARGAGARTLRLEYKRPWEPNSERVLEFRIEATR